MPDHLHAAQVGKGHIRAAADFLSELVEEFRIEGRARFRDLDFGLVIDHRRMITPDSRFFDHAGPPVDLDGYSG